jgi:hypothetical protein
VKSVVYREPKYHGVETADQHDQRAEHPLHGGELASETGKLAAQIDLILVDRGDLLVLSAS